MLRDDEMDRRLQNWARWRLGPRIGGLGFASRAAGMETSSARYRQSTVPTSNGEAEETARGVAALESDLRRTVEVYYLDPGSIETKARKLCVVPKTLYLRIARAHVQMSAWVTEMQRARRDEQARLAALMATARKR